ncbi:hypothetical protein KIN20_036222 [Parelaphostrongylus tenuis]|uniref:Uncharacterized protein n=1 Tax=Parelaphostrongylus tenuis TaxID=148309 RepID=A0AAD5WL53_PARTN|nr:hypothetical protein KIN20_036222 [Parelaphostrongylus tenuis]
MYQNKRRKASAQHNLKRALEKYPLHCPNSIIDASMKVKASWYTEGFIHCGHIINLLTNMTRLSYDTFIISMLATMSTVFGCGVMPAGQISTRSFTVRGFTLPVAMAYSTDVVVRNKVPGIAESQERARAIVERLVSRTVFDTLETQGRNALLPDAAI